MHSDHSVERRREYRVPLAIPATFFKADMKRPFNGYIENISSYGALAKVVTPLPKDTFLKLFFKVPETGERVDSGGAVRWCRGRGIHPCRFGIEFCEKVFFNLPLYEVARLYSQSTTKASTDFFDKQWELLQKSIIEFQHLTYWGALFLTFSDPIHTLFSQLAGQIGLSSFRFEKFYRQMEKFSAAPKLKNKVREAISALDTVSGKFSGIASVFGLIKKRQYVELTESKCHIDLNHMIRDKINSLQNITIRLTNRKSNINYLPKEDLPLVCGQYSDFAQNIDFLLLYSYQSVLFGGCTEITVQSMVKNQTIQIDFFNDGSRIFEEECIVIDHINDDFVDQLSTRDVKNVLGLYYSLIPLKKCNAYIVVHSEPGNNIVSLRIPM